MAKAKKKTAKKTTKKSGKAKKELKKKPVKVSTKKIVKKGPVKKKAEPKKLKSAPKEKKAVKKAAAKKIVATKVSKPVQVQKKEEEDFVTPEMVAARRAAALKKIKGYGKKELDHFRQIILDKRDEILEQLQNLREQMLDPTTGEYINENSPYSLHMAEQGTDAMEREKTYLYAQRENKFLGYLEDALKRIDNGTYGICVDCIEEPQHNCPTCPLIPKERLEAVPHSQLCLPMKQKQEKR
jgi:RNA polymerase-binding transcription factor DksA